MSENGCVPLNPMVLLIIIPMKNGYFIGNIPYFQTNPSMINKSVLLYCLTFQIRTLLLLTYVFYPRSWFISLLINTAHPQLHISRLIHPMNYTSSAIKTKRVKRSSQLTYLSTDNQNENNILKLCAK